MEVGPWRMDGKGGWNITEGGWEEYTTMVYGQSRHRYSTWVRAKSSYIVDQPAGTGFSYTSTDRFVHTLDEVCTSMRVSFSFRSFLLGIFPIHTIPTKLL